MNTKKPLRFERLEARRAPAVFFASGTTLAVRDAAGNDAQNLASETAARAATGATKAILLDAGDTLVFDANNNHVRDPQERVLMSVAAGRAMVFLSNGFGQTAGAFDENEISGLAVSDGFQGTIHTDVNGAITTTLDPAGNFQTTALQNASVAGLTIDGRVLGDLTAGRNIRNVRIGPGLFTATPEPSVHNLFTGDAADTTSVRYSFAGPTFALAFTQPAGANGGSISNVRLDKGVALLVGTGNGGEIGSGAGTGGNGGSISGLTVVDSPVPISIATGAGGGTVHGNAGAGGGIFNSSISFRGNQTTQGRFSTGFGGNSDAGNGGNGGAISGSKFHMLGDGLNMAVLAGIGGRASGTGTLAGGGGAVVNSTIIAAGSLGVVTGGVLSGGILSVFGGTGGDGVGTSGGPGGAIVNTTVQALDPGGAIAFLAVAGGNGGSSTSGRGGPGGALTGSSLLINEEIGFDTSSGRAGQADVGGGNGGSGVTRGGDGGAFNGNDARFLGFVHLAAGKSLNIATGDGGSISGTGVGGHGGNFGTARVNGVLRKDSVLLGDFDNNDEVSIRAGVGGSEITATSPGSGGAGGNLSGVSFELLQDGHAISILGGRGGDGGTIGNGGVGGTISSVSMALHGVVDDVVQILGGDGGNAGTTKGTGGAGGNLTNVTAKVNTSFSESLIFAGNAGSSRDANGATGGNVNGVTFENDGPIDEVLIESGSGSGLLGGNGNGGNSGSLSNVIVNSFADADDIFIEGGGTSAHHGSGNGGNGGALSNVTINNYGHSDFIQVSGASGGKAGDAGGKGDGGKAGSVSNVTINDFSSDGQAGVSVKSQSGGAGQGGGIGGSAGPISNVSLFGPRSDFQVIAAAGGGGASLGGNGGSVSNVHGVVGSLGIDAGDGGAGTGAAGKGGNGGPVTGVNITGVGSFVRRILAGTGGNGTVLGGDGGSISRVNVAGDIGNFASAFSVGGMGGLIAGQAGAGGGALNGSISQVTATRIAAIFAGRPTANNITAANAVQSLTQISAQVIGADVNHNEVFDFTNAGPAGFNLGDGDTAIDGFVLVKHASDLASLTVAPLMSVALTP